MRAIMDYISRRTSSLTCGERSRPSPRLS